MVYKLPTNAIEPSNVTQALLADDVKNALVPVGGIIMWSGSVADIGNLTAWELCDGQSGRPDLRDKFIIGAGTSYNPDAEGGEATKTLGTANIPSHTHTKGTLSVDNRSITGDVRRIGEGFRSQGTCSGVFTKELDGNNNITESSSNSPVAGFSMDASHDHGLSGVTGDQGGAMGQSFSILPPYYALAFIIRVL